MVRVIVALALSVAACSSQLKAACVPGRTEACPCLDGLPGFQTCRSDGLAFGRCQCDLAAGGGVPESFGGGTIGGGLAVGGGIGGGSTAGGSAGGSLAGGVGEAPGGGRGWSQEAILRASNADEGDSLGGGIGYGGRALAISADGNTIAVGAPGEASGSAGVGGIQTDNSVRDSGAVSVFVRGASGWRQEAYVKASNPGRDDQFGKSVALSGDGNTLAVGAFSEDSSSQGINGVQNDEAGRDSGAVYVFTRVGGTWSQQAYVKASNAHAFQAFGESVALSRDGNTLGVGACRDGGKGTGINTFDLMPPIASGQGAAFVFVRTGSSWSQQAYIKPFNNLSRAWCFGESMTMSGDGNLLAVGSPSESFGGRGVNPASSPSAALLSGAVYVYARSGSTWLSDAYLKSSNSEASDYFGRSVHLSESGLTLAIGATGERSQAAGVNGDQSDNTLEGAGAVFVFRRSGPSWSQSAYLKASNPRRFLRFGWSVALNADGGVLVAGAEGDDNPAIGIDADQLTYAGLPKSESGSAYNFQFDGLSWRQQTYFKAERVESNWEFGDTVAVSADGRTFAVGHPKSRAPSSTAAFTGAVNVYVFLP